MSTPLSARIRPNSEAAPWVVEEVKALEAEIERLRRALAHQEALVDMFEPLVLAACKTPPKRCKCEGCVYRREWEGSDK